MLLADALAELAASVSSISLLASLCLTRYVYVGILVKCYATLAFVASQRYKPAKLDFLVTSTRRGDF